LVYFDTQSALKSSGGDMSSDVQKTVDLADHARQSARRDAGLAWLATALYAAFAVTAVAIPSGTSQGKFFWVVAAPLVAFGAMFWAYSDGRQRGVEASRLTLIAVPFGLLTAAFGFGAVASFLQWPIAPQYGPPLLLTAGYITLGLQRRDRLLVGVGIVVLIITIGLVALRPVGAFSEGLLFLAYAGALLAARIGWRLIPRVVA
jgi:hypothetical protein